MCVGGYKEFSLTYSNFNIPIKHSVDISNRYIARKNFRVEVNSLD